MIIFRVSGLCWRSISWAGGNFGRPSSSICIFVVLLSVIEAGIEGDIEAGVASTNKSRSPSSTCRISIPLLHLGFSLC